MDPYMLKATFFWALVSRISRLYFKSKREPRVETYLPEGMKFILTYVFIYIFGIAILGFFEGTSILINKIF